MSGWEVSGTVGRWKVWWQFILGVLGSGLIVRLSHCAMHMHVTYKCSLCVTYYILQKEYKGKERNSYLPRRKRLLGNMRHRIGKVPSNQVGFH